ncbi:hypothetical protein MKW98_005285 [Papaver atlanticum]|uniref:Uncharacterized protein n=1 Tax=Papaver atlanticum TaxID=357466 RepID=A0AAD4RWD6_9MAGN|nr:hypothetical protein MKW98_005285 [Papaver atlanticum]
MILLSQGLLGVYSFSQFNNGSTVVYARSSTKMDLVALNFLDFKGCPFIEFWKSGCTRGQIQRSSHVSIIVFIT